MSEKLKLPNVTIVIIDCYSYGLAAASLRKSMDKVDFGAAKFLTDMDVDVEGVEVIKIPRISSKAQYSKFVIRELYKYIETEYVLITQHDSWVLFPEAWDDNFFKYDILGAAWLYEDGRNNSNGGFSLRSKRFCEAIAKDETIEIYHPCDEVLCRLYRTHLENKYAFVYPDDDTCDKFSFELRVPYQKTFGFHGYFHHPFKEHIVLCRPAALGDLIMLECVIDYYATKGYQVVIDTAPHFMEIFNRYRHRVIHISEMNPKIVPIRKINFEMVYENQPKKLVMESYIEVTGENIPLRNSQLDFPSDSNTFLISKSILIHIDEVGLEHRNCHGVNWAFVVGYYTKLGYLVFQIGKRMKDQVAPYLNTANLEVLMLMVKGADLVIAIDSSPAQIAVALGTPAAIFFGSVNPALRYLPSDKIIPIHSPCVKPEDDFCYHSETGTTGVKCKYNELQPACSTYSEWQVIEAANKLLKLN